MSRILDLANFHQFTAINVLSDPGHIPGPVVIPNVLQVRLLYGQIDSIQAVNVTHARFISGLAINSALAEELHQGFTTLFTNAALETFWPSGSSFFNVDIRDLSDANNPVISGTPGAMLGTSPALPLPNEVAAVLTLRTAKTGPGNRGRVYMPNWASNASDPTGVIDPLAMTALQTVADGWISVYSGAAIFACVAQPARAGYTGVTGRVHLPRDAGSIDLNAVAVRDNHWDSQRRRGLK